ncbi:MAG: GNAT family N-acetyltransferase [Verrucomicrobia bacterium]|nr:GNAT family N-acetyltransferase [Verrucomicrobiota bacterium]
MKKLIKQKGIKIHFQIVNYGSDLYKKSVSLREEVLRKPLGLIFTKKELELEKEHIHIAGFYGHELCATALLAPHGDELKLQRVVTKAHLQRNGIGTEMMRFCEEYASKHGYKSIFCHAREAAIPFYLKNRYVLEGEPFEEEGLQLHKMRQVRSPFRRCFASFSLKS